MLDAVCHSLLQAVVGVSETTSGCGDENCRNALRQTYSSTPGGACASEASETTLQTLVNLTKLDTYRNPREGPTVLTIVYFRDV